MKLESVILLAMQSVRRVMHAADLITIGAEKDERTKRRKKNIGHKGA